MAAKIVDRYGSTQRRALLQFDVCWDTSAANFSSNEVLCDKLEPRGFDGLFVNVFLSEMEFVRWIV